MVATYKILKSERIKHVIVNQRTSYRELEKLFYEFLLDPDFARDLRIFADLRGMTDAVAGLWELHKLAELYKDTYRGTDDAINVVILVRHGVAFRAARAFKLFMRQKKPLDVRITHRPVEAQELLGIDKGVAAALSLSPAAGDVIAFPAR